MPLDPNIILGAKSPQFDLTQFSPMNALTGVMKLRQLDQEGELNALTLGERKGVATFLAGKPDLKSPKVLATLASDYGKTGRDLASSLTGITAASTAEATRRDALTISRTKQYRDRLQDVNTQADALNWIQQQQSDPDMANSPIANVSMMDAARKIPTDPAGFEKWKQQAALGLGEWITQNKPQYFQQDTGPTKQIVSIAGMGGPATVVPGSVQAVTATPAQLEANRIAQSRLALDQNKFAWEKSNPGYELKEAEDGTIMAINKRTLQAVPVTVGGAAPAAAGVSAAVPAAAGAGMPSARVPAAATPAPMAGGTPLRGKGKEAPVKFNDTDLQLSGLAGSLKDFRKEVAKDVFTGAKFLPTGADTARMQAKYTALLMGVKDLYTLGALTGPDMGIIESQLTNPASWSGKLTSKEGFEEQIKVIENMLKRSATNLENTYSRVPKATKKALQDLSTDASGAGVDTSNPLLR